MAISLFEKLLAALILFPICLRFPVSALPLAKTKPDGGMNINAQEIWHIQDFDLRLMGRPPINGTWPVDKQFHTEVDFTVNIPDRLWLGTQFVTYVRCWGYWDNGTLPSEPTECGSWTQNSRWGNEKLFFALKPYTALGPRRPELSFYLALFRTHPVGYSLYWASQAITVNEPSEPTSYLTCLERGGYKGIRCSVRGHKGNGHEIMLLGEADKSWVPPWERKPTVVVAPDAGKGTEKGDKKAIVVGVDKKKSPPFSDVIMKIANKTS